MNQITRDIFFRFNLFKEFPMAPKAKAAPEPEPMIEPEEAQENMMGIYLDRVQLEALVALVKGGIDFSVLKTKNQIDDLVWRMFSPTYDKLAETIVDYLEKRIGR
jgi:hypothetical protein